MTAAAQPAGVSTRRLVTRVLMGTLFILPLVFLSAGTWKYWQGWVYLGVNTAILIFMALMAERNPALAEERLKPGEGMKRWDRWYFALSTPLYFLALIISGLDVGRFGWSAPLPFWTFLLGLATYLAGQGIFLWARFTNQFFSSVVRLQVERGQTVCSDGPYRFVRHPGYVGGILFGLGTPLLLGSLCGLGPAIIAAGLLIWRTGMEDRTLQAELPGYLAFTHQTRYRLLPGIW